MGASTNPVTLHQWQRSNARAAEHFLISSRVADRAADRTIGRPRSALFLAGILGSRATTATRAAPVPRSRSLFPARSANPCRYCALRLGYGRDSRAVGLACRAASR